MATTTLEIDALIASLRDRAARHTAQAARCPEMGEFYGHLARQCTEEARDISARRLQQEIETDPFSQAMAQSGATEIQLGRAKAHENGLKPAPRTVLRAQWPHGEVKAQKAPARRWPL